MFPVRVTRGRAGNRPHPLALRGVRPALDRRTARGRLENVLLQNDASKTAELSTVGFQLGITCFMVRNLDADDSVSSEPQQM